jgi:SWI/SNF-related matrix-associated actin-dependent regulator of chromatin subfamily A-like protein 1
MKEVRPEMPAIEFDEFVVEGCELLTGAEDQRLIANEERMVEKALDTGIDISAVPAPTLRRYAGLAVVPAAVDLVKMRLNGGAKKLVLFAYHRGVIDGLMFLLSEYNPAVVDGRVNARTRDHNIRRFQEDDACGIFIGQLVAAGTNIDLSVADEALFVEASWVPGENAQPMARLQNVNKTRPVTGTFVTLAGSVHERIQAVNIRKTKDLTALFA